MFTPKATHNEVTASWHVTLDQQRTLSLVPVFRLVSLRFPRLTQSPTPVPFSPLVVKNAWKIFDMVSALIPEPSSAKDQLV